MSSTQDGTSHLIGVLSSLVGVGDLVSRYSHSNLCNSELLWVSLPFLARPRKGEGPFLSSAGWISR